MLRLTVIQKHYCREHIKGLYSYHRIKILSEQTFFGSKNFSYCAEYSIAIETEGAGGLGAESR